jgi:hypothetical protein
LFYIIEERKMAKAKTSEEMERFHKLVDRITDVCRCVRKRGGKFRPDPKCKVCDGSGKPKVKPI